MGDTTSVKTSALYRVKVTNELFHNGNVEAWKNLITTYSHVYFPARVQVFYNEHAVANLDSLFTWGKISYGSELSFSVASPVLQKLSVLKRSLEQAASSNFMPFLDEKNCLSLWQSDSAVQNRKTGSAATVATAEAAESDRMTPARLNRILQPRLDEESVSSFARYTGGLPGSFGAAVGRAFFSPSAIEAFCRSEAAEGRKASCVLLCREANADSVSAIKQSVAVIAIEGGYAAHAAVLARQFGRPAVLYPNMQIIEGQEPYAILENLTIRQGDYLSLSVAETPLVYAGKGVVLPPDSAPLADFIVQSKRILQNKPGSPFKVLANCDSPEDFELALRMGAEGIGLCRTEHMFFGSEELSLLRKVLFASEDTNSALDELTLLQTHAFYRLFALLKGRPVTVRLLDAPLHEFMPHDAKNKNLAAEKNPMLGHRGCRLGISHAEIYAMQVKALALACADLERQGLRVDLRILLPMVMNQAETKLLIQGSHIEGFAYQGLQKVFRQAFYAKTGKDFEVPFGVMIELPAAALDSAAIAQYASFFSYGTNDLTQTTHGLSRDDSAAFLQNYETWNLIENNPFRFLTDPVKELIKLSLERGRASRSDLPASLCGEQASSFDAVGFCLDQGIQAVSCSPLQIPYVYLALGQLLFRL